MFKKLKSVKLTTIIVILSTISFIFTAVISLIGYSNMKSINNNLSTMYKDNLTPITSLSAVTANFVNIQLLTSKAQVQYDPMYDLQISSSHQVITKELEKYSSKKINGDQAAQLNTLKNKYSEYIKLWNNTKVILNNGQKLQGDETKQFEILGSSINSSLQGLIKSEVASGNNLKNSSDKIYSSSVMLFLVIVVSILIVFLSIAAGVIRIIKEASKELIEALKLVSQGDFTIKLEDSGNNEFSIMKGSVNDTIINISSMLHGIKDSFYAVNESSNMLSNVSDEMAASSSEISTSIQDISDSTSSQASDITSITEALNEFSNQLISVVESIEDVKSNNSNIHLNAMESTKDMKTVINSVEEVTSAFADLTLITNGVGTNIKKITEITNLINNIAEQTNLLSLNAAIEAARAGETGKGFSVVAEEIRKLSEKSKVSSENITVLINNIFKDTELMIKTTDVMNNELLKQKSNITTAIDSYSIIKTSVDDITPKIEAVNSSVVNLNNNKNYIIEKLNFASSIAENISSSAMQISASSEEMTASSEEVASTAQNLNSMTKDVINEVDKFKLPKKCTP